MARCINAPKLDVLSHSTARRLQVGNHVYVYCEGECIAYKGPAGRVRRGAVVEIHRRALHEFSCMTWHVLGETEFERFLPVLTVTP